MNERSDVDRRDVVIDWTRKEKEREKNKRKERYEKERESLLLNRQRVARNGVCFRDGDQKPVGCGFFLEMGSGGLIGASDTSGIVLN